MKKIFYFLIIMLLAVMPVINASNSQTTVEFTNTFDFPVCYIPEENDFESWWIINNNWIDARTSCYRSDGFPGQECCPITTPDCKPDNNCYTGNDSCREFSQSECNGNLNIAKHDLEGILNEDVHYCNLPYDIYDTSPNCYWFLRCECQWDGSVCKAVSENLVFNGSKLFYEDELTEAGGGNAVCGGLDNKNYGECLFDITTTGDCNQAEGIIRRSWTVDWTGTHACTVDVECGLGEICEANICMQEDCKPGSDEIRCSNAAKLVFFNWINITAIVIILIIAYYLYSKRKKRK